MQTFPENYTVIIPVPFLDLNGAAVVPTAASAKLYDDANVLVADLGPLSLTVGAQSVDVTVPAIHNALGVGQYRALRLLKVEFQTDAGILPVEIAYGLGEAGKLVMMGNTFQSLGYAELTSVDYPNASGWAASTDLAKRAALSEAFRRVTSIPMRYTPLDQTTGQPIIMFETVVGQADWLEMTEAEFRLLPLPFQRALCRAQFIEADVILTNDVIGQKRRQGILSETIGESSVQLAANKVDYGISHATLQALIGFVYFNNRIFRA